MENIMEISNHKNQFDISKVNKSEMKDILTILSVLFNQQPKPKDKGDKACVIIMSE